jgi:hypothetical protein
MVQRSDAGTASALSDTGTYIMSSVQASMSSASSASTTASILSAVSSAIYSQSSTQLTPSVSVAVTASGVFPASPTQSFGYKADRGADFGNVIINNWCSVEFVIYYVGAYHMGGNRTKPIGNGTRDALQDYITHPVPPNGTFTAPFDFRKTCPNLKNITDPYCADMDKLRGQDVSLKIANITPVR